MNAQDHKQHCDAVLGLFVLEDICLKLAADFAENGYRLPEHIGNSSFTYNVLIKKNVLKMFCEAYDITTHLQKSPMDRFRFVVIFGCIQPLFDRPIIPRFPFSSNPISDLPMCTRYFDTEHYPYPYVAFGKTILDAMIKDNYVITEEGMMYPFDSCPEHFKPSETPVETVAPVGRGFPPFHVPAVGQVGRNDTTLITKLVTPSPQGQPKRQPQTQVQPKVQPQVQTLGRELSQMDRQHTQQLARQKNQFIASLLDGKQQSKVEDISDEDKSPETHAKPIFDADSTTVTKRKTTEKGNKKPRKQR